jgi:hypothetical protein
MRVLTSSRSCSVGPARASKDRLFTPRVSGRPSHYRNPARASNTGPLIGNVGLALVAVVTSPVGPRRSFGVHVLSVRREDTCDRRRRSKTWGPACGADVRSVRLWRERASQLYVTPSVRRFLATDAPTSRERRQGRGSARDRLFSCPSRLETVLGFESSSIESPLVSTPLRLGCEHPQGARTKIPVGSGRSAVVTGLWARPCEIKTVSYSVNPRRQWSSVPVDEW